MTSLRNSLLDLLFPPRPECPLCRARGKAEICAGCRVLIENYRNEPVCARCGRLPGKGACFVETGGKLVCPQCLTREWPFVIARAAGPYEGNMKEAIHRLKYEGKRSLAVPLAGLMAETMSRNPAYRGVDLVVPVPLFGEKLRRRGFNQAEILARNLSRELRLPLETGILRKILDTPPQAGLSKAARESNLEGAFKVTKAGPVTGRKALLIDDVFTTGSTMSAAALAIMEAGAGQVFGLTVATGRFFEISTKTMPGIDSK
ncbi:MAG: ComF family protein [Firmicutes bacterium]|nr:ComF family protein [Bacillota bacterium]